MGITFVVLNYKTYDDTIDCVASIESKMDVADYHIVIVDNGSGNESFRFLNEKLGTDEKIKILKSDTNLGFAKGMNLGIRYARENYDDKFIVACNSDINIISDDIYSVASQKYEQYEFAVLGPMVYTLDGYPGTNPIIDHCETLDEVNHVIKRCQVLIKLCKLHILWIYNLYRKIVEALSSDRNQSEYISDKTGWQLHGCFLMFSPAFFKKFDGFDEGTFLYGEESILFLNLTKEKMISLYTPDIKVLHKEESATKNMLNNNTQKVMFQSKIRIDSMKRYLEIMNNYEKVENGQD